MVLSQAAYKGSRIEMHGATSEFKNMSDVTVVGCV